MTTSFDATQTMPAVDQVLDRLRQMGGESIALSLADAEWLLAEIDGGREAFGVVVQQKKELEQKVKQMRSTIDGLLSMRGK